MKTLIPVVVNKADDTHNRFLPADEATLKEVGCEVAHTITSTNAGGGLPNHNATMVIEGIMNEDVTCKVIGNIPDEKRLEIANRVYSKQGLSPCINAHSGDTTPKIVDEPKVRIIGQMDNTIDHTAIVDDTYANREPRCYKGYSPSIRAEREGFKVVSNYRIRKLTPLECFRLMGVTDEDAEKIMAVNSNSKCYQQAGDSIVVDVMCAMFRKLNIKGVKNEI